MGWRWVLELESVGLVYELVGQSADGEGGAQDYSLNNNLETSMGGMGLGIEVRIQCWAWGF